MMNKTRMTVIATVSALSLGALSAYAHGGGHGGPEGLVQRFDANKNGKLEVTELPAPMKEHLAAADTNKDGVLTVDELKANWEAQRAERKAAMDTNKDGKISDEERAAYMEAKGKEHFAKMDTNHDGFVTKEEAGKFWAFIGAADTDKNGAVTQAEIKAAFESGTLKMPHHGPHHGDRDEGTTKS